MKAVEKSKAILLRQNGYSIKEIARQLHVSPSSVSLWVRDVVLSPEQMASIQQRPFSSAAIEKRRLSRLTSEHEKRKRIILSAQSEVTSISHRELWLMGVMLYWAEGGKTQRLVRFSNGDPNMITIMMQFFRVVCRVPDSKFRGHIHIHPHLDYREAEGYWSDIACIPVTQFFKTYRKPNKSSSNKKNTLPHGVFDIYVMDSRLFLQISGWAQGIFRTSQST